MTLGCAPKTIEIRPLNPSNQQATVDSIDWSDWALTLTRICRDGYVDYGALLEDRRPLDRALARIAAVGLSREPSDGTDAADVENRIAFGINCYNAMMVRSMLELAKDGRIPATIPGGLESRCRFKFGDAVMTPAQCKAAVMQAVDDDWRVRFALCDGRLEGPPLPPRPFLGDLLDAQLNDAVRRAFRCDNVVHIDHGEFKELRLWPGLYDLREDLIGDYERRYHTTDATMLNVLLEWSERDRREVLNSAVGYAVTWMHASGRPNALDVAEPKKGIFSELRGFHLIRPN